MHVFVLSFVYVCLCYRVDVLYAHLSMCGMWCLYLVGAQQVGVVATEPEGMVACWLAYIHRDTTACIHIHAIYPHTQTHRYIYIHIHTLIYPHTHATRTCFHTTIYIRAHTHTHAQTHTHAHIHTHTCYTYMLSQPHRVTCTPIACAVAEFFPRSLP